jgi:hypothetical protein
MKLTTRKYKNKKNFTKKNKNKKFPIFFGGNIDTHNIFKNIKSIGFEIETIDLTKLTLVNEKGENLLINSSLSNADLEYGYNDPDEYTYIKEEKNETFKITNDDATGTDFNNFIQTIYKTDDDNDDIEENYDIEENDDDELDSDYLENDDNYFFLEIPNNSYLKQTKYNIKFREPSHELTNFSSFNDVEFISTFYNINVSKNVIVSYFFETMNTLIEHINKLIIIPNSKMYVNKNNINVPVNNLIEQLYILPNTTLMYYNTSLSNKTNYDIKNDMKFVPQMTFSCNIDNCYKIMITLLYLNKNQIQPNSKCLKQNCPNLTTLINRFNYKITGYDYDEYVLVTSLKITNLLFSNYKSNIYKFIEKDPLVKTLKMYFFLIIYKLFIYINSYIPEEGTSENMFKKHLSFVVRHSNYILFLEIKKILSQMFFNNDDNDIRLKQFITEFLNIKILEKIYDITEIKNKRRKLEITLKNDPSLSNNYFGNPLYSFTSYFEYFFTNNDDWLVTNNIDEKSTKFELSDNTIIIEFRDFPFYMYLHMYITSNDSIKNDIIQNEVGTLKIQTIKDYIKLSH